MFYVHIHMCIKKKRFWNKYMVYGNEIGKNINGCCFFAKLWDSSNRSLRTERIYF